ncbi:MAG: TetR/AcrR family transcriptional regulator [Burkholderiaceae bacterium]|nr:TetR/AcrR family transcriptional regulator [Burkholderiaceae bacterium]
MADPVPQVRQTRLPTEARQAEIVDALLRLAETAEPTSITCAHLARAVGLTQGAVFRHFDTKDDIWRAAIRCIATRLLDTVDAAAARVDDPLDALAAVFHAHVEFIDRHPGVPRIVFHTLQDSARADARREVQALQQAYRGRIASLLEAAVTSGRLPQDLDRTAAATLFIGLVQALVMQALAAGGEISIGTGADRVFALFIRGLGSGAQAPRTP